MNGSAGHELTVAIRDSLLDTYFIVDAELANADREATTPYAFDLHLQTTFYAVVWCPIH